MVAVSGGLIFIGYQLMVYGWSQVRGSNAGFFDILWPGRYKGAFPDAGAFSGPGTVAYGPGVTGRIQQGVTSGKITQQTGNLDTSGNATIGLGSRTFTWLTGKTPSSPPKVGG